MKKNSSTRSGGAVTTKDSDNDSDNDNDPGELGVDWAASVDIDESALFDGDDHKLDVVSSSVGDNNNSNNSSSAGANVQQLDPENSRLASFSSGLKHRISETSEVSRLSNADNSNNSNTDNNEDADTEEEQGDAFAMGEKKTKNSKEEEPKRKSKLSKELSTNWMKFDDDKWDASKHKEEMMGKDSQTAPTPEQAPPSSVPSSSTPVVVDGKKNGDTTTFSLEAGLAQVSDKTKSKSKSNTPAAERTGGADANELISFWGEGSEEDGEESANDPLAIALKAKPASASIPERNNDSSTFQSALMGSKSSTLDNPHSSRSSSLGLGAAGPKQLRLQSQSQQHHPTGDPGWIQKGLGQAIGMVASNLPSTNSNAADNDGDDNDGGNDDDDAEEDNFMEVDDMPFFNYTKTISSCVQASRLKSSGIAKLNGSMQDISAMSDDSAFEQHIRRSVVTGSIDDPKKNRNGKTPMDPCNAVVDKMNEHRITFAEDSKTSPHEVNQPTHSFLPIYDLFVDLPHPAEAQVSASSMLGIASVTGEADEIETQNNIHRSLPDIICLAFPDYDSTTTTQEQNEDGEVSADARKHMKHPLEAPGFQHHTFSIKLQSGNLAYAHVRRYLPALTDVTFRYDVGHRLGRAMVIFSRYPGGDDFFASMLRTLDAISSQHAAMHSNDITRPQKLFLQNLSQKHQRLCGHYATNFEDRRGAPHIITLQGLEFADCMEHYATVDATHFSVPNNLLHAPLILDMPVSYNCSILPVMRCLGVVNTMRLLSAMMSERRIVLVSASPARLDRSIRAAMSILSQGMLKWQHMCIPVLPSDLWSCLSSSMPYIVGVLAPIAHRLALTDDLGDVAVFNLDEKSVTAIGGTKIAKLVPDVCRSLTEAVIGKRRIPLPETAATAKNIANLSILNSTSDILAQDLVEILKSDKQTMHGTAATAKHMAKKASKAMKSTIQYLWGGVDKDDEGEPDLAETKKSKHEKQMEPDYVFIEGCRNVAGEEAARLAFVSFFLRVLGNSEGYVYETDEPIYSFNKDSFLAERKERGDGPNTPMGGLVLNFCETKMVQEYIQFRENYVRKRQPAPIDAPLFWKCIDFLELKNIDYGVINIRSVARMMLQKSSVQQMLPSNVRQLTMALTSKRKFEGNVENAISDLAELSRESGSAIYDVMSVVWLRTRDCKGLQWVHGYQAMKVLLLVLLHGPLSAIAHASDGIQTIRTLAFRNSQGCEQIQVITQDIYNLLSDRSRLVLRRRVAAEARRKHCDSNRMPLARDTRFSLESSFKEVHAAMHPSLRPPEVPRQRRVSLSSRRASLSSRLPPRLSITKHIMALEPMEESMTSFPNFVPIEKLNSRHSERLHDTLHRPPTESVSGSLTGDITSARRYVREVALQTADDERSRTRESAEQRDSNAVGQELLKKQFMLLKVAIYICPIFYFFGNHEHFLTIVMFVWLSQQLQVFKAPIDKGSY